MAKTTNRVIYTMLAMALGVVLLTWISHSGRKAEPPKAAPIPWTGPTSSQVPASATKQDSPTQAAASSSSDPGQQSPTAQAARPATQPSRSTDDASSSSSDPPPRFSTSVDGEESAPADSDQSMAAPQETAAQRVARHLRRR